MNIQPISNNNFSNVNLQKNSNNAKANVLGKNSSCDAVTFSGRPIIKKGMARTFIAALGILAAGLGVKSAINNKTAETCMAAPASEEEYYIELEITPDEEIKESKEFPKTCSGYPTADEIYKGLEPLEPPKSNLDNEETEESSEVETSSSEQIVKEFKEFPKTCSGYPTADEIYKGLEPLEPPKSIATIQCNIP